jgi:DNA-binding transcriptional MocR family regulator
MVRKQVIHALPSLQEYVDAFHALDPQTNRQAAILTLLRKAAEKMQGDGSRAFYSMRQITSLFQLPLRTVAIAYEQLEKEGLLNRMRGSQTILEGCSASPRDPVRAIVGLPIWLHAIVVSPYSRGLYFELEERVEIARVSGGHHILP